MKRWGTILCLCLLPILLFSACAEATAQVDFVANKDVKKIFDDVHTVGYILDDIRKVDFYKEMQPNDSYTKKQVKSTKLDTTVTKYYRNEDLVYAAYEKGGKQMTEFHLRSTHSNDLTVTSVLSGNRNFEGRISPDVKMNYLASPPLVIAYALAGTMDFDFETQPLGKDQDGNDVYLKDIWPTNEEVAAVVDGTVSREMFLKDYASVFEGDRRWKGLDVPEGELFAWDENSTYVRKQTFFDGMKATPDPVKDIHGARVLALLGDSVTTDHISPAGAFKASSPAGKYLTDRGVEPKNFNSYGSRRGNHEVMVRGTFGNIRLRNQLLASVGEEITPGGYTYDFLDKKPTTIFEASRDYIDHDVPLVVLAGKEYGTGSSRDWAAKGTVMLGVKTVITESFERIHRSNLIGMGVLPLQFPEGESYESLGLNGTETYDISGVEELNKGVTPKTVHVTATHADGSTTEFDAVVRIDTPGEADYYRNGGILQYVLRNLMR